MTIPLLQENRLLLSGLFLTAYFPDDSAMDLNDIDFDDDVPDVKTPQVKQEKTTVQVKTEPVTE